jgi:hypothetical protein
MGPTQCCSELIPSGRSRSLDDAVILSVHTRDNLINLFALVDLNNTLVLRRFVCETDGATTRNWTAADYIGSTVWDGITFHLFEVPQ